ncbi:MAG: prepilin-type N-terminal cleavage/methylation domain-containing protein [Pseudomonadales bacterium]|nr:prepilin-type N-terminal cleavage/methylation domain-containing protein [Candidatus Woesebacteria bacterium]MCB9801159.1 prepilin-type N-terminal cleavage/methylation domain-containing protein [Pseudomonadales bacterium]
MLILKRSARRYSAQSLQSGITLIEMIITVALMLIVFTASIAGFFRFNDRQTVQNTANEVKQFLSSARTRARVRDNPDPTVCSALQGYKVETNGQTLEQKAVCGLGKFSISQEIVRDTYDIPTGLTVTDFEVTYFTLQGLANVVNNDVYISRNSNIFYFQVRSSGEVTEGCYVSSVGSTTCL